jgi:RNA recognition motif-containing protein
MSVRLYVGNLPTKQPVAREDLKAIFTESGQSVSTPKVPKDRKGNCKGFAFITVADEELANEIIEKYNGQEFMGSNLKIEKALPRAKGKEESEEKSPTESSSKPSKRSSSKRNRRQPNNTSDTQTDSIQPDPRWAQELAILKERLNAQTSNS